MRTFDASLRAILIFVVAMPLLPQTRGKPLSELTVVLHFKGEYAPGALKEMEREASQILEASGYRLGWDFLGRNPGATYDDLVVVTFHGSCEFSPVMAPGEPGAYAFTHITDGNVQPFAEVDCDRVAGAVLAAMTRRDYPTGNQLVGRALGRVVAHELVHMVTRSTAHSREGVQQTALSGKQLIGDALPLGASDVERIQQERNAH